MLDLFDVLCEMDLKRGFLATFISLIYWLSSADAEDKPDSLARGERILADGHRLTESLSNWSVNAGLVFSELHVAYSSSGKWPFEFYGPCAT